MLQLWVTWAGCLTCMRCSDCNLDFSDAWLLPVLLVAASLHVLSTLFCSARVRGRKVFRKDCGMLVYRPPVDVDMPCDRCCQCRGELMAMPSLANYAVSQPRLQGGNNIHFSWLLLSWLREWALVRCGHHPSFSGWQNCRARSAA